MTRLLYDIEDYLEDAGTPGRSRVDAPDLALDRPHSGRDGRPNARVAPGFESPDGPSPITSTVCRYSRR